ncbi:hypothetical protein K450DRAFT_242341 [Umbelopsis ramanniana AG]|uniref:Uncharacterized protein n=1 Tax=Umbelopsis ramanniana AG TaxID=1314678 RepID=A0AAD5E8X4_UMBRA|nr:uncharacterized protein K450DRAFT_242341 [Umbelopsis ramanniana AG]KAI8579486.1 hypothetical protein K450DRAFT_242341 [Umbelopsis ramanniana AG]
MFFNFVTVFSLTLPFGRTFSLVSSSLLVPCYFHCPHSARFFVSFRNAFILFYFIKLFTSVKKKQRLSIAKEITQLKNFLGDGMGVKCKGIAHV